MTSSWESLIAQSLKTSSFNLQLLRFGNIVQAMQNLQCCIKFTNSCLWLKAANRETVRAKNLNIIWDPLILNTCILLLLTVWIHNWQWFMDYILGLENLIVQLLSIIIFSLQLVSVGKLSPDNSHLRFNLLFCYVLKWQTENNYVCCTFFKTVG